MRRTLLFNCFLLLSIGMFADIDVTDTYVENPNFEARFAGWDNNGFFYVTNSSFGQKNGMVYMERWVASGSRIPNVEISQELYLPTGTYKLTAGCQNIQQSGNVDACVGATLYANQESTTVTESKDYSVIFTVLQGTTRIGFKVTSTNANWAAFDNIRLTLLDSNLEAEHAELQKLIDEAENLIGEGEGADELALAIEAARDLIDNGSNENIGSIAKNLSDATLNYRILNATGTAPRISTNKFVAAGATILLGRMTVNRTTGILEKGFCWSTNPEPTIFDNRSTRYFSNNGEIYRMERLQPGTMYYVRPYALTTNYQLVYGDIIKVPTLPRGTVTAGYDYGGSTEENYRIASAIEEIMWLYNNLSSVNGIYLNVHYGKDTPSADCSYGGWMRVGPNESYQQTGTILHETNHGVGVGTSDVWWNGNYRQDVDRGKWLGPRATQMIQFLNKDNSAYMTGDNTHMWPVSSFSGPNFGINGSWEDEYNPENTLLYYGNVLITHALHQDGLICSSSVGFASPAYTFAQEDNAKYYIKTTDESCGNETTFLYVAEDSTLVQKVANSVEAKADDIFAWNILYDPETAYYTLRNVGTGLLLTCTGGQFGTSNCITPTISEHVQLLPSRSNYNKGPLNTPSYWITINKVALKANNKTAVGGGNFDANDSNTKQHWLVLTEDQMTTFDQYCTSQAMSKLDDILAAARASMQTESLPLDEEMSLEEVSEEMTQLLQTIEAEKDTYRVDEITSTISNLRSTFIAYLHHVKPASPLQPIPITWLIKNPRFDEETEGWTGAPGRITNGVVEFSETTFNINQTISPAMPVGNYTLTLQAFQRPGNYQDVYNDWAAGKQSVKAQFYAIAGGKSTYLFIKNIWDDACAEKKTGTCSKVGDLYVPANAVAANSWFSDGGYQNTLWIELTKGSTVKIGLRCTSSGTSWWTCFDNFGLEFYGPYDETTGISKPEPNLNEDTLYDLSGREIVSPSSSNRKLLKGVYINKGKKILF